MNVSCGCSAFFPLQLPSILRFFWQNSLAIDTLSFNCLSKNFACRLQLSPLWMVCILFIFFCLVHNVYQYERGPRSLQYAVLPNANCMATAWIARCQRTDMLFLHRPTESVCILVILDIGGKMWIHATDYCKVCGLIAANNLFFRISFKFRFLISKPTLIAVVLVCTQPLILKGANRMAINTSLALF